MRRSKRQRGQALVEFALVFPVFMILLAGMIQFGMLFWGQNTLNQLVRDTGRYAATRDCTAGVGESQTKFNDLLAQVGGPWRSGSATVSYSATPCPVDNSGVVWVHVTASYDAPIFFPLIPGNGHLTSSTDFRVEPKP